MRYSSFKDPTDTEVLSALNNSNNITDEFFGRRMQMLNDKGGNRFFGSDPTLLVDLAAGDLSDTDMLETFLGARDQIEINRMKETFESLPPAMQRSEFILLDPKTQKVLLGQGYNVPKETFDKPWYNQLFDHKPFGISLPTAGLQMMASIPSYLITQSVKALLWPFEKSLENTGHFIRSTDAMLTDGGLSSFWSMDKWKESWRNSEHAEVSFHNEAVEEVRSSLGDTQFELLKAFMAEGTDGPFQIFLEEVGNEEQAQKMFYDWYGRLSDSDMDTAIKTLSTNVNNEYLTAIKGYNALHVGQDITPDSMIGKIWGTAGSLATTIMLDPTTHINKIGKILKATRLQVVPGKVSESIEIIRKAALQLFESDEAFKIANGVASRKDVSNLLRDKQWMAEFSEVFGAGSRIIQPILTSRPVLPFILRKRINAVMAPVRSVNQAFIDERKLSERMNKIAAENWGTPISRSAAETERLDVLEGGQQTIDVFGKIVPKDANAIKQQAMAELGDLYTFDQLIRDYPMFSSIMELMIQWHRGKRYVRMNQEKGVLEHLDSNIVTKNADGDFILANTDEAFNWAGRDEGVKAGTILDDVIELPDMESLDGYFEFMKSSIGFEAIVGSKAVGTDPDIMLLPMAFGIRKGGQPLSVEVKKLINKPIDFANMDDVAVAQLDMTEVSAKLISEMDGWVYDEIVEEIAKISNKKGSPPWRGWSIIKTLDKETIMRLVKETPENRDFILKGLGMDPDLVMGTILKLEDLYIKYQKLAPSAVYELGTVDEFFKMHAFSPQNLKASHIYDPRTKTWKVTNKGHAARRAQLNYLTQMHAAGGTNDAVQRMVRAKWQVENPNVALKSWALRASYYPAKFAKKFLTYMPTQQHIDVGNTATAITEFKGLVEMGVLTHMPRSSIDDYMHTFIVGDEAAKWRVQLEFFNDFMIRSGAMLHGGDAVQTFMNRFIRHSSQRYGWLHGSDTSQLAGVQSASGLVPSASNLGHMSDLNVLPNYRELGAVARYMGFYRNLGWGTPLPMIDKLIARTWRPAVLLRLGYVPRNGGEELVSWMLRDGVKAPFETAITRQATDQVVMWDKYGQKILKNIDDAGVNDRGVVWGSISRLWRSVNELARVGDKAITKEAIRQSVLSQGGKWEFLTQAQKTNILDTKIQIIRKEKKAALLGWSNDLFKWSEMQHRKINKVFQNSLHKIGLPNRREWAKRYLERADKAEDINILRDLLNHPTVLDQHMKHLLGSFDTYLSNDPASSLSSLMRQFGQGTITTENVLKINLNAASSELQWLDNIPQESWEGIQAVLQRTRIMSEDPGHRAAAGEMAHFVSVALEQHLKNIIGMRGRGIGELPKEAVLEYAKLRDEFLALSKKIETAKRENTQRVAHFDTPGVGAYTRPHEEPISEIVDFGTVGGAQYEKLAEMHPNAKQYFGETIRPLPGGGITKDARPALDAPVTGKSINMRGAERVSDHTVDMHNINTVESNPDVLYIAEGLWSRNPKRVQRRLDPDTKEVVRSRVGSDRDKVMLEMGEPLRDLENVILVPVKTRPGRAKEDYFTPGQMGREGLEQVKAHIDEIVLTIAEQWATGKYKRIVIPEHMFGGSVAQLESKYPTLYRYINDRISEAILKIEGKKSHPSLRNKPKHSGDTTYNWKKHSESLGYTPAQIKEYERYLEVRNRIEELIGIPLDDVQKGMPSTEGMATLDIQMNAEKSLGVREPGSQVHRIGPGQYQKLDERGNPMFYDDAQKQPIFVKEDGTPLGKQKSKVRKETKDIDKIIKQDLSPVAFDDRLQKFLETVRGNTDVIHSLRSLRTKFFIGQKDPEVNAAARLKKSRKDEVSVEMPTEIGALNADAEILDDLIEGWLPFWEKQLGPMHAKKLYDALHSSGGVNPNGQSWLLNALTNPTFRPEKMFRDYKTLVQRSKDAMSAYYRTPEGQQSLLSQLRTTGGNWMPGTGPVQMPLPANQQRVYIPMIDTQLVQTQGGFLSRLTPSGSRQLLDGQKASAQHIKVSRDELKTLIIEEIGNLVPNPEQFAEIAVGLIHPKNDLNNYLLLGQQWSDASSTSMPVGLMTADPHIAKAVSRALNVWSGGQKRANISDKVIETSDLFPQAAKAAQAQGQVDVPLAGFGAERYFVHSPLGGRTPASMSEKGMSRELIWGVNLNEIGVGSGLHAVPWLGGEPAIFKNVLWQNKKTRQVTWQREGANNNRPESISGDFDDWEIVDEYFTSMNDLHNAGNELAIVNVKELEHLVTNSSKSNAKPMDVFHPWLDSVQDADQTMNAGTLQELTASSGWWKDGAPDRLLGYFPVTSEGGTKMEKLESGWNTLLRNWFDGVVNPMIGAMVREPLFHHYFIKAYKQTQDVRGMHGHSPSAYKGLRNKTTKINKKFVRVDDATGQISIDAVDDFIRMEWPLAKGQDGPVRSFVEALESRDAGYLRTVLRDPEFQSMVAKSDNAEFKDFFRELILFTSPPEYKKYRDAAGKLHRVKWEPSAGADKFLDDFVSWANNRKLQFDRHRDVATRRAMYITSNFIDDHRIRSQFQGMVGTMIPFWFAEDQFLRRVGRSLKQNPLMFRNANLWMMAGVNSGLVQEDQFGNQRLVYPGSGMMVRSMMEIVDHAPWISNFFGGDLSSVVKSDLSTNINIIPGYNFNYKADNESFLESDMGFGPLAAIPIMWASQIDPSIRQTFEDNLVGARYIDAPLTDEPDSAFSMSAAFGQMIGALTPALVNKMRDTTFSGLNLVGMMDDPAARSKAAMDVLMLRWMNGRLPTSEEIARQSNPAIYKERLFDEINAEATQLQLLQTMTWFFGPGTANFSDLVLKNDAWEWNQEFYSLLDKGLPYEEAYLMWQDRIIKSEGSFNPYEYSPFISKKGVKIPLSALDATQESNAWLTNNQEFVKTYDMASGFFMPRRIDADDDEYSAEARSRQIAYGLFEMQTPEEFLDQMYFRSAFGTYQAKKSDYYRDKFALRARGLDTSEVNKKWNAWSDSYLDTHPVFAQNLNAGESGHKREVTINQFRRLVADTSQIPDVEHRDLLIETMGAIVAFKNELDSLKNIPGATGQRNEIKLKYYRYILELSMGQPVLNEMVNSVFMPLIGDTWVAKLEVGLLEFPRRAA